jgi:hypothetical protein
MRKKTTLMSLSATGLNANTFLRLNAFNWYRVALLTRFIAFDARFICALTSLTSLWYHQQIIPIFGFT